MMTGTHIQSWLVGFKCAKFFFDWDTLVWIHSAIQTCILYLHLSYQLCFAEKLPGKWVDY